MSQIDENRLRTSADFLGEPSKVEVVTPSEDKLRAVRFFKEYARHPTRKYTEIATKLGIPKRSAENYVERYLYLNTVLKDRNKIGPDGKNEAVEVILRYFNEELAKAGIPRGELITAGEISRLSEVLKTYENMYHVSNSGLNTNINDNTRQMSYYPQQEQYPQEDTTIYDDIDSTPEGILKQVLLSNRKAMSAAKVPNVLRLFSLNPNRYMQNPDLLRDLLALHLEPAFKSNADSMVRIFQQLVGDMTGMQTMGGMMGAVPNQGIYPAMQNAYSNAALEQRMRMKQMEDEAFNEQLNKMMKMTLMQSLRDTGGGRGGNDDFMKMLLLSGGMKAQMRFNPQTGMNEMNFVPNDSNGGSMNNIENTLVGTILKTLLDKTLNNGQDPLLKDVIPELIKNSLNQKSSVLQEIQAYKEIQGLINPTSGPPSRDELEFKHKDKELDIKKELLMHDIELKNERERHERDMREADQRRADETLGMVIQSINGIADKAGPFIMNFLNPNKPQEQQAQPTEFEEVIPTGQEMNPYDIYNGPGTSTVDDAALYESVNERVNRSVEENRRYTTDVVNDLKQTIQEVKQQPVQQQQQQPQSFFPEDFSSASDEDLRRAREAYEVEKQNVSNFMKYGELLENELRRRNQQNYTYENVEGYGTDYIGGVPEEIVEKEPNIDELVLDIPELDKVEQTIVNEPPVKEEKLKEIPRQEPEPEPEPVQVEDKTEPEPETDLESQEQMIANIKLDEDMEKKIAEITEEAKSTKKKSRKKKDRVQQTSVQESSGDAQSEA